MDDPLDQATYLSLLSRSQATVVKLFAEALIPQLEPITVLRNRTGLAMLPARDTAQGANFYLGEVLLAEAHVRVGAEARAAEGYAACLGRDLEQALAIALIDAAVTAGIARPSIAAFVQTQAAALHEEEQELLRQVAATRVEMETF